MDNKLSQQVESELRANNGLLHGRNFVVMSIDVYRDAIGDLAEEEMAKSLAKIDAATIDVDEGRTRPLKDAVNELGRDVQG